MLAGRPHEAAGNGSPRWMAVGPRNRVTEPGLQADSPAARALTRVLLVISSEPNSEVAARLAARPGPWSRNQMTLVGPSAGLLPAARQPPHAYGRWMDKDASTSTWHALLARRDDAVATARALQHQSLFLTRESAGVRQQVADVRQQLADCRSARNGEQLLILADDRPRRHADGSRASRAPAVG